MLSRDMRTVRNSYQRIKDQYSDILDSGDLRRIFRDDQPLRDIVDEVKRRAVVITIAWIAVVTILAGVAYALSRDEERPIPQQIIESPGKR